jgi:hypothetical protein
MDTMGNEEMLLSSGLEFFGKVTASVSHEIKNSLAIMREQAGLMEDLLLMAEKGLPLNPERLKTLSGNIHRQTERADEIVKNLNRFAHCIDEAWAKINLGELTQLVCELARRLASMKGVELALKLPGETPVLQSAPFSLANLLWQCIQFVLSRGSGGKGPIELRVFPEGECWQVTFGGFKPLSGEEVAQDFPGPAEMALLERLRGSLRVDADRNMILLKLPKAVNGLETE